MAVTTTAESIVTHHPKQSSPLFSTRRLSAIFACTAKKTPAVRSWKNWHDRPKRLESSPHIGISPPLGLLVIDLDTYKGVTEAQVDAALGSAMPWDEAFLQSTPSGGGHYVFQVDQKKVKAIRNSHDTLGVPGFDIRCPNRGYIVTGDGYRVNSLFPSTQWALENGRWPELPDAACRALASSGRTNPKGQPENVDITMCNPTVAYGIPRRCIPTDYGQRNACLMLYSRWFKGRNLNASDVELREALTEWYIVAVNQIKTKDFAICMREFTAAYRNATTPFRPSLDAMVEGFENEPLPEGVSARFNATICDLYRLAARLKRCCGNDPFHLSCRVAGKYLDISHVQAAKYLKLLVRRGFLAISKAWVFVRDGASRATEYLLGSASEKRTTLCHADYGTQATTHPTEGSKAQQPNKDTSTTSRDGPSTRTTTSERERLTIFPAFRSKSAYTAM